MKREGEILDGAGDSLWVMSLFAAGFIGLAAGVLMLIKEGWNAQTLWMLNGAVFALILGRIMKLLEIAVGYLRKMNQRRL